MSSKTDFVNVDPKAVYSLLGGCLAGACVSQLLYGRVLYLPVSLGSAGGVVWYITGADVPNTRKGISHVYSSKA